MTTIELPAEELETWLADDDGPWALSLFGDDRVPDEHKPIPPPPAPSEGTWHMTRCIWLGVIVLQGGIPRRIVRGPYPVRFTEGDVLTLTLVWSPT